DGGEGGGRGDLGGRGGRGSWCGRSERSRDYWRLPRGPTLAPPRYSRHRRSKLPYPRLFALLRALTRAGAGARVISSFFIAESRRREYRPGRACVAARKNVWRPRAHLTPRTTSAC